jgi:hypothetical protein
VTVYSSTREDTATAIALIGSMLTSKTAASKSARDFFPVFAVIRNSPLEIVELNTILSGLVF